MNNIIRNPKEFDQSSLITEDRKIAYFLTGNEISNKADLVFDLEENVSFDVVVIDFTHSDLDMDITVNMKRNSKANVYIASIDSESFRKKFSANINHNESDTYSRTKMAGINAGSGSLKFLGASNIVNGAHRSDTRQEGKITNLSLNAKSECSPTLLIKDNDVKASHGAALGAYNSDQLFYLMSRGLTMEEGKKLITFGSLLPIIEELDDESLINEAKESLEGLSL